ncbi:MAG: DHH family phosphoesterase [Candidatus Nanoarchaeia archaeon]
MKKDIELDLVLESAGLKPERNKSGNRTEKNKEKNKEESSGDGKSEDEGFILEKETSRRSPQRGFQRERTEGRGFDKRNSDKKTSLESVKDGDYFEGIVKITRKARPGPVVFSVTDGTMTVDAVTKDSEYEVDAVVNLSGPVSERAGRLQIEIRSISKADANFEDIINEKSAPKRTEFSISSDRYEKMKPRFLEIARRIRKAVLSNQPILIRHHNDSDGINSGLAIEQACKGLMHRVGINPDYNLFRSPSKAPFYEVSDVFRDIGSAKRLVEGHDQKSPLVLVLDNGSTPEDAFAFKMLHSLGYEAIVIDHHNPVVLKNGRTSVCDYLSYHLNPYMFGLDSQTSAGMLCYEMARFIDEEYENKMAPAVAAISDRCTIPETDEYIKNSGATKDHLTRIGVAIDFVAYQMKFDAGKGVFEELYRNDEMVDMINSKVQEGADTQLMSTLPYLRTQEINGITFSYIDLEKYTLRFTYPTPGKVIGMIHDKVAEGKENAAVLSIGYVSDMIIIRATKPVLPVQKIISTLQKELPEANVDGGGHECAGTIKFVPAHLTTIIEKIKGMLKEVKIE